VSGEPGPILEIHMQSHAYDCRLCGAPVPGPGGWCLMVRDSGGGILVCQTCHDAAPPSGEIDL
jgi:hypothetical protein